ncbi:hypothetical protein MCHI_004025, partial [Candidatus Magnetoovum chiemensis]
MEIEHIIRGLSSFLTPFIYTLEQPSPIKDETSLTAPTYEKEHTTSAQEYAARLWNKIKPQLTKMPGAKETISDIIETPSEPDIQASFRMYLKKLLTKNEALSIELSEIWGEIIKLGIDVNIGSTLSSARWMDVLDSQDGVLKRLEMIRLLRTGMQPEQIAAQFHTDLRYLYRVHSAFT